MYSVLLDMVARRVQKDLTPVLRAGNVLHGTVEGPPGNLSAVSGSLRVPLPEAAPFQPRQPVLIEVRDTPQGLQLLVRPSDTPPGPSQPPLAPTQAQTPNGPATPKPGLAALIQMVAGLFETAGSNADAQLAAEILPQSLPASETAVREFLAPFKAPPLLAEDWGALMDLVARAAKAGAVSRQLAGRLHDAMRPLGPQNAAETAAAAKAALARAAEDAAPIEARIAAALGSDDPEALRQLLEQDPRSLVDSLRKDAAFRSFLRESGQTKTFELLADRVSARLAEPGVQNVRRLDQPYIFVQIPCSQDGPIRHGHMHVFSGGKGGGEIDSGSATIALDVSTVRLGDLWITLKLHDGRCACRICAKSERVVDAVRAAASELESSLMQAGYAGATVQAVLWDGNRLRALADLIRTYSRLDVEA